MCPNRLYTRFADTPRVIGREKVGQEKTDKVGRYVEWIEKIEEVGQGIGVGTHFLDTMKVGGWKGKEWIHDENIRVENRKEEY